MDDWLVNHWGDLASALGFVVSVVGFSIALVQIRRSRKAAEAAEEAVTFTREVIARNLTIDDIARTSQRIQHLKELHWEGDWRRALDRYYDLRITLSDISAQQPNLSTEQRTTIQGAIQYLQAVEDAVGISLSEGSDPANIEANIENLNGVQSLLDGLASELKQSV